MSRLIRALIDTRALQANLSRVREVAAGRRVIAVVKANGYGHGLVTAARAFAGADMLAVARLEEAVVLREAGIHAPLLLLEGVFGPEELAQAAALHLDLVVHEAAQLALLEAWRGPWRFALWLKVDSGMNRLGFRAEDFPAARARVAALAVPPAAVRVLTHLATADEPDDTATRAQLARFEACVGRLGLETSIGNSAGIFASPRSQGDWVRPGLALYGASPFADRRGVDLGLQPAMTLVSSVIAVRSLPHGEAVGYGATWRAVRDSRVAIIAAGYGDGLIRDCGAGASVLVGGQRAPLVGRVSMDMLAADVTGLAGVEVGTPVQLWGPQLPVEEVAGRAGTIAYELLCSLTGRVPRVLNPPPA